MAVLAGAGGAYTAYYWSAYIPVSLQAAIALFAAVLAALVMSWASRINERMDHELDRTDGIEGALREQLAHYISEQRRPISAAGTLAAVATAIAPAALVYLLTEHKATEFDQWVTTVSAGLAGLLLVRVLSLRGFVHTLDTFHEEISKEIAEEKARKELASHKKLESAHPWQ